MSLFKSLTLSAFALALFSIPAMAQVTAVEGMVKDEAGKPLPGAVITFDRTDIKGKYTVKSDKKGHYGHYGLPIGTYNISVAVDGKERDKATNFRTGMGDPKTLNFDLKQSQDQAQALAAAAATGTLSKEQERGMSKEQKEAFDKAAKAREAQLAKNKELNEAYTAGKNAVEAKQWDVAIENLEKANTMDATQGAIWSVLAEAYVGKAQATPPEAAALYEKGFAAFAKAIEIAPDAGLYNNYALALAKNKKIDDAKANLAKAAELDPPGAGKYYYNLGALLVNSGQNDAATDTFKKAIDLDPAYADAQYQYGVALAGRATTDATGKVIPPPGAIDALQKYLQLKPDGSYAQQAKEMIAALGGTVSTTFTNPNAPQPKGKKK
ncbi:MAG: repeat-containing protein [Bryobacterales bacterium]|nr:repeat-containing protein [Bryobacterales bacterium]